MKPDRLPLPLLSACLALFTACGGSNPPQSGSQAAPVAGKPTAVSVAPQSGAGATQVFTTKFSHPGGYQQLADVRLLINAEALGYHACYVYYDLRANAFLLVNDASAGSVAATLGTGATVQNSQCSVTTEGASATGNGNEITVTIPIKFKPAFAGVKKLILFAEAVDGANTDLVLKGDYTVSAK